MWLHHTDKPCIHTTSCPLTMIYIHSALFYCSSFSCSLHVRQGLQISCYRNIQVAQVGFLQASCFCEMLLKSYQLWHSIYYSAHESGVLRSVCLLVCLFVCPYLSVREHIAGTAGPIFSKCLVQIPCGRGSVLLWQCCDTLCTSSFMDEVMFRHSGPYGDVWLVALWYRGRVYV